MQPRLPSTRSGPGRRRLTVRVGAPIVAALFGLACERSEPATVPEAPPPPDVEFSDAHDLLESIGNGTFAERAGLREELEALRVPAPVRIDFVSGTRVPDAQDEKLGRLARDLDANDRLRVDIAGCSDPPGSEALNRKISQSRADAVAARLRELGVPARQIGDVVGRGEDCEEKLRMVEITPSIDGAPADEI